MSRILIVDDEPSIGWALQQALCDEGHHVDLVPSAEDAWARCEDAEPDVIVMDVRLPGIDGLEAMRQLPHRLRDTPVVIMTAFGNLDTAVRAINSGAFEYLTKPFDLDDAVDVIRRALEVNSSAGREVDGAASSAGIGEFLIGKSPAMQAVFRRIALAAEHDVPVLISGESGTGKELVAMALHRHGSRADGPFVPICVPAMSEALVESELFGHRNGAFTGATADRTGLLAQAQGGIAFLDEIGDITPAVQVKLLRVLETKQVVPVGANAPITCNFRLIAATHRNLQQLVEEGRFREDLFYRLNVFRIDLPPLRDRSEDIPLLARHFLVASRSTVERSLSGRAIDELVGRPWYGNVRELRNAIEHASILARSGSIEPHDLPPAMTRREERVSPGGSLAVAVEQWLQQQCTESNDAVALLDDFLHETEPVLIRYALSRSGGNRQEAAAMLGIHRQTLREKVRRFQIDDEEESR
ncbi:MAG: sigma 54-interacting transcriptional regulator [Planctomycetaceae bacterium]